jgi:hypothetical protein
MVQIKIKCGNKRSISFIGDVESSLNGKSVLFGYFYSTKTGYKNVIINQKKPRFADPALSSQPRHSRAEESNKERTCKMR